MRNPQNLFPSDIPEISLFFGGHVRTCSGLWFLITSRLRIIKQLEFNGKSARHLVF